MSLVTDNANHSYTITPARSRRYPAEKVTDADFADDLALLSNTIDEAHQMLTSLEEAAGAVGLIMNESKTNYMSINLASEEQHATLTSSSGNTIGKVEDFVYLGSWVGSSEHDFTVRKAKAWASCHKMKKIWKFNMCRELKIRLFIATVESILLYGSETWTITKTLSKKIDGCYTRMLRMALDIDWRAHKTNKEV